MDIQEKNVAIGFINGALWEISRRDQLDIVDHPILTTFGIAWTGIVTAVCTDFVSSLIPDPFKPAFGLVLSGSSLVYGYRALTNRFNSD